MTRSLSITYETKLLELFLNFWFITIFCGMVNGRRNRKIANQGEEKVVVTVTVADSFSDLDLVVEALELAGADLVDGMSR